MSPRFATHAFAGAIVLMSGSLTSPVRAAEPQTAAETDWNYPAPVRTWNLEGGYRIPIHNDQDDTSYYRISYKGSLVDSKGTPLSSSQHFEITEPKPTGPGGDRSALELLLAKGAAEAGGQLLEMNGAKPLELRGIEKLQLRGAAYVGADLDGDNVKAAVGLESRPLRIPGASAVGASNWLVIGVMGERSEATDDTTKDSTYGLLTGRLFLGKAFGWRKSASIESVARRIEESILATAGDLTSAQKVAADLEKIKANQRTKLQQLFIDTVADMEPTDDWKAKVRSMATGTADALTDKPTFALYMEATGWNAFSPQAGVPKHRGLVTLTADYWPITSRDDIILRARYEWGFQRAQPDIRLNQFLVTLTVQL
jgi:hypothetical protein